MKKKVYNTIKNIQNGHFNKNDIPRYDPKNTGHGVTVSCLSSYFLDTDPAQISQAIKELSQQGKIQIIDDGYMVSFVAI